MSKSRGLAAEASAKAAEKELKEAKKMAETLFETLKKNKVPDAKSLEPLKIAITKIADTVDKYAEHKDRVVDHELRELIKVVVILPKMIITSAFNTDPAWPNLKTIKDKCEEIDDATKLYRLIDEAADKVASTEKSIALRSTVDIVFDVNIAHGELLLCHPALVAGSGV